MAPAYASHSTYYSASTAYSVVLDTPSGTQAGDLLIAILTFRRFNTASFSIASGWEKLIDAPAPTFARVAVFYRLAEPAEPTTHAFNCNESSRRACGLIRFTGVDQDNPIHAYAHSTAEHPELATTRESLILRACGNTGNQAMSYGTGYDHLWSLRGASDSAQCHAAVASQLTPGGLIPALAVGSGVRMSLAIAGDNSPPPTVRRYDPFRCHAFQSDRIGGGT